MKVPFLRPNLVPLDAYADRLRRIDSSRKYSNFGPLATEFEKRVVAELFGGDGCAVTVCNATLGLMLAIAAIRRPGGRLALMPSYTFAATPLAAQWCGLSPYFFDVRAGDWCPDEDQLHDLVKDLADQVAVVVTYATFGVPMRLQSYEALIRAGVPVVVDAAPGLGARTTEGPFAAGFPGLVVFSLHATKTFGIGEGGLVYGADEELVGRVRRMSNFGFDSDRTSCEVGLNAKMPEIAAAVALATLDVFPTKMARRIEVFRHYQREFDDQGLTDQGWSLQQFEGSVPHQFAPALAPPAMRNSRVVEVLAAQSIEARHYFSPACHHHPQFARCQAAELPNTLSLESRCVSLPLWEEMTEADVRFVASALRSIPQDPP